MAVLPRLYRCRPERGMGGALSNADPIETRTCLDESNYFRGELADRPISRRLDAAHVEQLCNERGLGTSVLFASGTGVARHHLDHRARSCRLWHPSTLSPRPVSVAVPLRPS